MATFPASVFAFIFLWFVLRVIGKRELGEMSAFDLVILFVMGDLIAESVIREDTSALSAVVAIGTLALLTIFVSWLSFRFPRLRPVLDGRPTVILRDGEPDEEALAIERMSPEDLVEAAREEGIRDLASVDLVVLESDGKYSFFTRSR